MSKKTDSQNTQKSYRQWLNSPFIDVNGKPADKIKSLFKLLGFYAENTCEAYYQICQKHFLRNKNQYRWEIEFSALDELKSIILPLLEEFNLINAILPIEKEFETIFVHGGIYFNLRERFHFLDKLWSQGIRGDKIVIVSSERSLLEIEQGHYVFNESASTVPFRKGWAPPRHYPLTENEMARLIWDQIVDCEDLRNHNVEFIAVKNTTDPSGNFLRYANTEDTLKFWLKNAQIPRSILAVSNNPYIQYQHAKLRNTLYKFNLLAHCQFETVGGKVVSDLPIKLYLDTLARWFDADLQFWKETNSIL